MRVNLIKPHLGALSLAAAYKEKLVGIAPALMALHAPLNVDFVALGQKIVQDRRRQRRHSYLHGDSMALITTAQAFCPPEGLLCYEDLSPYSSQDALLKWVENDISTAVLCVFRGSYQANCVEKIRGLRQEIEWLLAHKVGGLYCWAITVM